MSLRLAVLGAGAVDGSVLDPAGDYGHEVVIFTDSSPSVIDPDGLNLSAIHDRKKCEGVVGGADPEAVLDVDYGMLVEATPTTLGDAESGLSHAERTLADDHHVAFTNKGPAAERYADLCALEAGSEGTVQLEAAVGDTIPILLTISDLGAPHVTAARGVLSGMANFVLSWMAAEGLDYKHILTETQGLGIVEVDPTFDVDDIDAVLKFVIPMSALSDGEAEYVLDDVAVGRTHNVPGTTLDLAAEDGQTVRLIGEAIASRVRVTPRLIPQGPALSVTGAQNIVQLETKHVGQLSISGRGAGDLKTATAVLSDALRFE